MDTITRNLNSTTYWRAPDIIVHNNRTITKNTQEIAYDETAIAIRKGISYHKIDNLGETCTAITVETVR